MRLDLQRRREPGTACSWPSFAPTNVQKEYIEWNMSHTKQSRREWHARAR